MSTADTAPHRMFQIKTWAPTAVVSVAVLLNVTNFYAYSRNTGDPIAGAGTTEEDRGLQM
jgi:hypothetical protein